MNRSFWEFISDCNFSKSACQVDVTYFNLPKPLKRMPLDLSMGMNF
tara:strand:+ start:18609 stop:18746 length:138 start_codon:yes stop_codon:yes gene_type:complete